MADLAHSIAEAKRQGYSDAEIAAYIAKDPKQGPKVAEAKRQGYSDAEIVGHLGKPSMSKEFFGGIGSGIVRTVAGAADAAAHANVGGPLATLQNAARIGDVAKGRTRAASPNLFSVNAGVADKVAYKPLTALGRGTEFATEMLPGAFVGGSWAQRAKNFFLPFAGGEIAGETARGLGADEQGQTFARGAGSLFGAGVASFHPENLFSGRPRPTPVQTVGQRQRLNPQEMQQRADEMRAAGVDPTFTDVAGERGRRVIRAVGVRSEAGGEALTNRANETAAVTKPATINAARRLGPRQGETAAQAQERMTQARRTAADTQYRPAYDTRVPMTDETARALLDEPGRAALRRARQAAVARMDEAQVAEIDRLLATEATPSDPYQWYTPKPETVSAGALDRTRIAMRNRAEQLSTPQAGGRDVASGLRDRVSMIDSTLDAVPEIAPARQAYRQQSQAIDVLRGQSQDPFTTDPGDYARWHANLSPQAQEANAIGLRQEIADTLGGQRSGTYGTLDQLATSPYARQNLRTAFGPQADRFLAEVEARLAQARNARFVEPNAGSRTAVLGEDVRNGAQQTLGAVRQLARGDLLGLAARAADAWRARGMSPQDAEQLARMAVDPGMTDQAIAQIAQRLEPVQRRELLDLRNAMRAGSMAAIPRAPEPSQQQ